MMPLLTHAYQNSRLSKLLLWISMSLGLCAFVICVGLCSQFYGFDAGYEVAKEQYEIPPVVAITFAFHGPRTYEYFAYRYSLISWFFCLFLVTRIVSRNIILEAVTVLPLGAVLYQLWWVFAEKSLASTSIFWPEPRHDLLRESAIFDLILLSIVSILLFIQLALLFLYFNRKQEVNKRSVI